MNDRVLCCITLPWSLLCEIFRPYDFQGHNLALAKVLLHVESVSKSEEYIAEILVSYACLRHLPAPKGIKCI